MKYMTPELLAATRSQNDEQADAAYTQWEQATKAYHAHIEMIRPKLTRTMVEFLDTMCLHDAHFVRAALNRSERKLTLLFEDGKPEPKTFLITYYLLRLPKITRHAEPSFEQHQWQWALYDEIDLFGGDELDAYTHSILFTGGCELTLVFSDMKIAPIQVFDPSEMNEIAEPEAQMAGS